MKALYKIISFIVISVSFLLFSNYTFAATTNENLKTGASTSSNSISNDHLEDLKTDEDWDASGSGESSIYSTLVNIAKDMKNIFFVVAGLYFLVIVIKLIFTGESDEDITKFKQGIIWISIGLIVTQIAYSFVQVLYDKEVGAGLAYSFNSNVIYPLIELLETGASFFFIGIAIFTFFRMITANGDEEKTKRGRYSVVYAMAGFIAIKFARTLVDTIYGKIDCSPVSFLGIISIYSNTCTRNVDLSQFAQMVVTIINWMNALVGIVVIILIIYTGVQVILSAGDAESLKKAKNSILYIALGIFLLFVNYLILTFFIIPESAI